MEMALCGRAMEWDMSLQLCWLVLQHRLGRALQRLRSLWGALVEHKPLCACTGEQRCHLWCRDHGCTKCVRTRCSLLYPALAGCSCLGLTGTGCTLGTYLSLLVLIGPELNLAAVSLDTLQLFSP